MRSCTDGGQLADGSPCCQPRCPPTPPRCEQLTLTLNLIRTLTRYEQALRRVAEQVALGIGLGCGYGFGLALALGSVAEQVELDA